MHWYGVIYSHGTIMIGQMYEYDGQSAFVLSCKIHQEDLGGLFFINIWQALGESWTVNPLRLLSHCRY